MTQKECQRNGNNQRFADALIMSGLSWRGGGERLWSVETVVAEVWNYSSRFPGSVQDFGEEVEEQGGAAYGCGTVGQGFGCKDSCHAPVAV